MTQGSGAVLSPARLLGVWERVRTSFWLVPAFMAAGAVLSFGTVALDRAVGLEAFGARGWMWSGGANGARSVLSTIAGSMATVGGGVFSVNVVALTLASSQFGPRRLCNFTRDLGNGHVANAIQAESLIAAVGRELREQIVSHYGESPARDVGNPGRTRAATCKASRTTIWLPWPRASA